jgi:hypothetical protein
MARFHQINGELVQFTAEEEIQRDAEIAAWVAGENDRAMAELRQERNAKLAASDWTQCRDITLSNDDAWKSYRTALRNLPANTSDPANPTWPEEPSQ